MKSPHHIVPIMVLCAIGLVVTTTPTQAKPRGAPRGFTAKGDGGFTRPTFTGIGKRPQRLGRTSKQGKAPAELQTRQETKRAVAGRGIKRQAPAASNKPIAAAPSESNGRLMARLTTWAISAGVGGNLLVSILAPQLAPLVEGAPVAVQYVVAGALGLSSFIFAGNLVTDYVFGPSSAKAAT